MKILRKNEVAGTRSLIGPVHRWIGGLRAVSNRMLPVTFLHKVLTWRGRLLGCSPDLEPAD